MGFSGEKQPVHLSVWIIGSTDAPRLAHKCVQQCLKKGSVVVWPGRRLHLRLYNYTSALESVCFDSGSVFSLWCCCDSAMSRWSCAGENTTSYSLRLEADASGLKPLHLHTSCPLNTNQPAKPTTHNTTSELLKMPPTISGPSERSQSLCITK